MTIVAFIAAWCVLSVVAGLAFGRAVARGDRQCRDAVDFALWDAELEPDPWEGGY